MQDEGWRLLTLRWIGFFIVLAIMNETVWRNFTETTWVAFKSFGVMPLTIAFMMAQLSLIMKYQTPDVSSGKSGSIVHLSLYLILYLSVEAWNALAPNPFLALGRSFELAAG